MNRRLHDSHTTTETRYFFEVVEKPLWHSVDLYRIELTSARLLLGRAIQSTPPGVRAVDIDVSPDTVREMAALIPRVGLWSARLVVEEAAEGEAAIVDAQHSSGAIKVILRHQA